MDKENRDVLREELRERGIVWQITGFAAVGIVATSVLALYSGVDNVPFRFLDVATSKLSWAFVPTLAFALDRSRYMFERRSDIHRKVRQEVLERSRNEGLAEGREEGIATGIAIGEKKVEEKLRERLKSKGISLPADILDEVFNHKNGKES